MFNQTILIGRLGRDPEMRYTASGNPVTSFSMATDETRTDKAGERQQKTEWHNIGVWGKLAEICNQYLVKGKLVFIRGKIQTREWEDKEGNARKTVEVVADTVKFLDPSRQNGRTEESEEQPRRSQEPTGRPDITDEDIPF